MSSNVFPRSRLRSCVWLVVALLAAARPAAAGRATAVILTRGDPSRANRVEKTSRAWLEARGAQVTDGGLPAKETAKLANCLSVNPKQCVDVIARTGADRLWLFQLEPKRQENGADVNIVLSVFGADGQTLATNERYCDRCRPETLTAQVEKVLDDVSRAALARTSARTVIRVRTEPAGALIAIDGKNVGTAAPEFEYSVNPGEHKITAALAHHEPATRRVELSDGEEKLVVLRLETRAAEAPVDSPTAGRRQVSAWPYVVGGAGVIALSTGITLLARHDWGERDGPATYDKPDHPVPGIVLTASGAVVAGAAVYLFVRSARREDPRVAPTVSVSGHELTFGVQGRF